MNTQVDDENKEPKHEEKKRKVFSRSKKPLNEIVVT